MPGHVAKTVGPDPCPDQWLYVSDDLKVIFNLPTHWLYRFLDNQKNTRSQFSIPGFWEIHRNLKQNKNFNSRESFFRKSPFCTFSCINPGFGGPWDKLWIFFLIAIFIMLQKNAFCQNGTFEPVHEIQIFLAKSILLKHYENGNKKKYS